MESVDQKHNVLDSFEKSTLSDYNFGFKGVLIAVT